jgi:hypothetical protein
MVASMDWAIFFLFFIFVKWPSLIIAYRKWSCHVIFPFTSPNSHALPNRNNLMDLVLSYQAFISGSKVRLLMVAALKLGKRGHTGWDLRWPRKLLIQLLMLRNIFKSIGLLDGKVFIFQQGELCKVWNPFKWYTFWA